MEAGELVLASVLWLGAIISVLYQVSPDLVDAMIHYLMNANIITVI